METGVTKSRSMDNMVGMGRSSGEDDDEETEEEKQVMQGSISHEHSSAAESVAQAMVDQHPDSSVTSTVLSHKVNCSFFLIYKVTSSVS